MTVPHDPPERAIPLPVPADAAAGGWYLLRGMLLRRGGDYDARLYYDLGAGWSEQASLQVHTTAKGIVRQLLCLPAGIRRLALHPGSGSDYDVEALRLRRIGPWRRRWWMLRDVVAQLWLQPRAKRQVLGLSVAGMLKDLPGSYRRAIRLRAHAAPPGYPEWIREFDTLREEDRQGMAHRLAAWADPPWFHVSVAGGDPGALARTRASLAAQVYRHFTAREGSTEEDLDRFNQALAQAPRGHWVLLLQAGDLLPPHALYWIASAVRSRPQAALVYADEDSIDQAGLRCRPAFKPDWSWAHARACRFFGAAAALDAAAIVQAGGLTREDLRYGPYALGLRVLEGGRDACHVPAVLLHRPEGTPRDPDARAWAEGAVRAHLQRQGVRAEVLPAGDGRWRVRHALPAAPPKVSVIVPTRDALALTRRCIESLRESTRYPDYEVLLVDNQSADPAALAWMREQERSGAVRLLHYDQPFNYSAINNMAVRCAAGELVCLLNNDAEVIQADWLEEMVAELLQPGVDVVGAKLLFPDGRVQHGGILLGVAGVANHAHAWLGRDDPGYCGRALVAQEYSAVTGACLLTRRERYLALGGLDARHLAVAFNDVDYCLRVREAGGHVVWTPHARLLHHESITRGKDSSPERRQAARREAAYMRRRWRHLMGRDPFYNPNLSQERPDFSLSHAPVVPKPWRN